MESGNGGSSSKGGVLVPVSLTSDAFQSDVLAPLKRAYLYEESEDSFRYKSAVLIKNPELEDKYNAFRAKRRELGYSEEDLEESYGFLLFDDANKANELGEAGLLTGNSTCTTLGDPSNGVYVSMYSDCLDINRWYNGKTGYIAIIRLTKGRVKKVSENYTQNFTAPTEGFDSHVSEELPSVSAKTSSFLAFERTQYYMYELIHHGSNETVQSPSAACPFAIVSFSYLDTKDTPVALQEKSEEKKMVYYFPWRGQLQIGTRFYYVELRSTAGALIPAELPPVVKVDQVISMADLKKMLPKSAFETCLSGEVCLDGLHCCLCELVSSEVEETNSLSLLLWEIKDKDVALTLKLNDGGFLILLHSSHFITYAETGPSAAEVMQGMFVFPDSRVIHRDTKFEQRNPAMSSEILRILPVLSYAESEVEKTPLETSEELCEVFVQHMQSYAALINPGLIPSPSRDVSIFPDQYDVPNAHKHLYSSPEWTNRAWQNFKSYLNKPESFQLPVSKASEILAAGQEERIEDLNDNVYFCLSSPEEAPANYVGIGSEDQLTDQKSLDVEVSVDSFSTSAEAQVDQTVAPKVVPNEAGDATKDTQKSDPTLLVKTIMGTKDLATSSTSDDLPAELIVSITSAKRTVTDAGLNGISSEHVTEENDLQLSGFSTAYLQTAGVNSLIDETVKTKKPFDCSELTHLTKRKCKKLHRGHWKGRKRVFKACIEAPSLQKVKIQLEGDNLRNQQEDKTKESSGHPQLWKTSNIDWKKVPRLRFSKLSSKNNKVKSAIVLPEAEEKRADSGQSYESTILMALEACPLRKKTERWDLRPVISECGRILVPHGSVDIADQIKALRNKFQSTEGKHCPEKMLVGPSVKAHITEEMVQEPSTAQVTTVVETEATTTKGTGSHPPNIVIVNPEHGILRQSDDLSGSLTPESNVHSLKDDSMDAPPLRTVQENHADTHSLGKCATNGGFSLKKLKSVLLRGKRKIGIPVSEERIADAAQETEPCLKKVKVDSDSGMLKSNDAITSVQDTNFGVKEVSKMLSLDPLFAFALGLTPKTKPNKIQKLEDQDTQREPSSETVDKNILDRQSQIIQRPLSILSRSRIKTLRRHQGISAENVKKTWWLHFQTPASFASEKLKHKENTRDNSVMKTVKEKINSACASTDALNLLADLALASNDKAPPQPDPTQHRKRDTSLKNGSNDVTSADQESVLHALLRQPAARTIQPQTETPSLSHLVGQSDLVSLICKDHAYSLPPFSSLLLGLSGTPFQVSPLSGSTRLLHHHQTMNGDGIKTLHPSVVQEDKNEHNQKSPEYLKKHMVCRRKFRHSRTFVNKDGSIQVTKHWKENYDFNLDSKFTSDLRNKTISRALHGPWDFSIQDTSEEVRLIVHMWIGLFYSRSTSRFFHIDSTCTYPYSKEIDYLENGMLSEPTQFEIKADSFPPSPTVTDPSDTLISKALDLSKKANSDLDQESVTLDLSLRKSSAEIVTSDRQINKNKTSEPCEQKEGTEESNILNSSMRPQMARTIQCYGENLHPTEIINEVNDVRSTYDRKRTCTPLEKAVSMEPTDVPSFKGDGTFTSVQEELENASDQPENNEDTSGIGLALHECNSETDMEDGIEKIEATEMSLVPKQGRDSSKYVADKEVYSDKKAVDVVHKVEHDEIESKDVENFELKEKESGNRVCLVDSSDQELPVMCDGPDLVKNWNKESNHHVALVEHPPQPDKTKDVSHDLLLGKLCAHGSALRDEHAISEEAPNTPSVLSNFNASSDDHEDRDTKSTPKFESEKNVDHTTQQQLFCHQSHSPQCEAIGRCQDEEASAKEPDLKSNKRNEGLDKIHSQAVIPFIGIDTNKEDASQPQGINTESKVEDEEALVKEPDLKCNRRNERLDGNHSEVVIPFIGVDIYKEDASQPHGINTESKVEDEEASVKEPDLKSNERNEGLGENQSRDVIPFIGIDTYKEDVSQLHGINTESKFEDEEALMKEPDLKSNKRNDGLGENQSRDVIPFLGIDTYKEDVSQLHGINTESKVEDEEALVKEPDLKCNSKNKRLDENHSEVVIPFIGVDIYKEDASQPHGINTESKVEDEEESVKEPDLKSNERNEGLDKIQSQDVIPFVGIDTYKEDVSQPHGINTESKVEDEEASVKEPDLKSNERNEGLGENQSRDVIPFLGIDTYKEDVSQLHSINTESKFEDEEALVKEPDLKSNRRNKGLDEIRSQVVIPFIGIDICKEDVSQSHGLNTESKVEEVQSQKELPFLCESINPEMILPTEVCRTSQMFRKNSELSAGKMSLLDVNETNRPNVSGNESDNRCPTPTIDEEPYQYVTSGPSSCSAISVSETDKKKPTVNINPNPLHDLQSNIEQRVLRVLQSTEKFLSKSSCTDKFSQDKTADMKHTQHQTSNTNTKSIPTYLHLSHIASNFKCRKICNKKPALVSVSTSQELHTESSGHFIISPSKGKPEEVVCDWMQPKNNESLVTKLQETAPGQDCHPFTSTECLQTVKHNIDRDGHKTTLHTNLSYEPRSNTQRPVMAVKPSKSDEIQANCISEEGEIEHSIMLNLSKIKQTTPPVVTYTPPASMLLDRNAESLKGNSAGLSDVQQKATELYTKSSWSLNESKSNSDRDIFGLLDPSCLYEGRDILKFNKIHTPHSVQSLESQNTSSEKIGQTTKESIQTDQKDCSDASNSAVDYKDDSKSDDSLFFGSQSSLTCTILNNNHKRSDSFLGRLSQRCIQDDLTKASMEQECLIFSEQMKQLLKRSKRPIHQLDTHDQLHRSCSSPVIVHFSNLEDQDDSVDDLDTESLLGQKIKVDMSDRTDLGDTTRQENAAHPQKSFQGTSNPMEHAGVSGVTAECAMLYTAMMNEICTFKTVPSRCKPSRMDKVYLKNKPSNNFDFCDEMKRDVDKSFHSKLNLVVKKSCKTKYRFYILVTSDDAFFRETKAQLEAGGHTAVQPSEFFLGEESSSLLLIILKNEDIAEHIYKVPHLLELKKSPSVQFAGIDKPDDVVNLTHQELFMRGGFVMFDSVALESLSLGNMKRMSEFLQELGRTGKWKWMLHYRDSRQLKENARFSAEAKEKKHFLNWCQEVGMLEVLPYHECDLMSRDQPDYLTCLVRLQVQNISARYPILVTDKTTDGTFGMNGIFTMTLNCFLTCSPRELFTV